MINQVISPITKGATEKVGSIRGEVLTNAYWNVFGIDVSESIGELYEVEIYKCIDTGYKFYYPFHIQGDEDLYNSLANNQWYYLKDKWEFFNTLKYLSNSKEILEIGCGEGAFMKIVKENLDASITGVELSEKAYCSALAAGLNVYKETIKEHYNKSNKKYDAVCSFQVLEHITDVKNFLKDMVEILLPHGLLIITVPNNESFMFKSFFNVLNFPPHHMGLWSPKSISKIQKYYPLKKRRIDFEPINKGQLDLFIDIVYKRVNASNFLIRYVFFKLKILKALKKILLRFPFLVKSHSMTIIFQKTC